MPQVSRPMQILLGATVLFAVAWFVALRPKPSGAGGGALAASHAAVPTAPGVKGLTTAIRKAHGAVATADAAGQRAAGAASGSAGAAAGSRVPAASGAAGAAAAAHPHGATGIAAPSVHATPVVAPRARHRGAAPAHHRADPVLARRVAAVRSALRHHQAIAIAFVDPGAADSRALAGEVAHVSRFGGRALTLSVSIGQLSSFGAITREVQVTTAPTVVIVARDGKATTIVGFADRFEIQQRLADALA